MSAAKRKGTAFESQVVAFLRENGIPGAERRALAGREDKGDVWAPGLPWILECKNTRTIDLAGAVDEATTEAAHAGVPYGAAVIKRRNKGVSAAYVVMPLDLWVQLVDTRPEGQGAPMEATP